MKPSRRNFLKVWASLAWISSFAGSGFILGLFRGKYRSGCTDGKRLCKGRKKRLSVRRRFPMADDGFVLNKRSKILHWPKFFKHQWKWLDTEASFKRWHQKRLLGLAIVVKWEGWGQAFQ